MTKARTRYTCRAISGCTRPPVLTLPAPLCRVHAVEITRAMLPGETWKAMDGEPPATTRPWDREAVRLALPVSLPIELPRRHAPVVYFVQNGSLVKIGWSTNLGGRLSALCLRRATVLLTVAGDNALEAALHRMFRDLRQGETEWFRYGQPLAEYVQKLRGHASPVSLTDLTEMLRETGSDATADDPSEEQPPAPLSTPQPRVRMPLEEAQQIFANVLEDLVRAGVHEFRYEAFQDVPEVTGWPKAWVYDQLEETVERGRLDRMPRGWRFREVTPP